jgi:DNA-directed RNA polymerase specialized sigma subunit
MASLFDQVSVPSKSTKQPDLPELQKQPAILPGPKGKSLLEEQFAQPYLAWQRDQSPDNTQAMLNALRPVTNSALRAFGGPSASSPTLRSQAKVLALEALGSYDPAKAPLKAHIMSRLQRLRRVAAQQRQVIRVPEQVAMDQMATEAARKELEESLGREPSDGELADYTGLSAKRLAHIRSGVRPVAESALMRAGQAEGAGGFEPGVTQLGQRKDEWQELVYSDVDPTNQLIMERVLGMHGHAPGKPSDIAKMLRISPAAVSHRMAQIQKKLDQRDQLGML